MSSKYPGGFITKSPVAPTANAASGIWTVDQAMQYQLAGTWPAPPSTVVDNYFFSFTAIGNGSSNNMYTGSSGFYVSLSTIGGLTWVKNRSTVSGHVLTDTVRGVNSQLDSSSTAAPTTNTNCVTGFYTTQFTTGSNSLVNGSSNNIVGWTFGRRIKFFDIVTYTGNGTTQTVSHNLGSQPGFILCKATSTTSDWAVWHRGNGTTAYTECSLNATNASGTTTDTTISTATNFKPSSIFDATVTAPNVNGVTYIAYLFAHNAGSFGASGTDNAISCGTFTAGSVVNLGYEPQWVMTKMVSGVGSWDMVDSMRGFVAAPATTTKYLDANSTAAENSWGAVYAPTATGFDTTGIPAGTYIYIAVRKAMYTPNNNSQNYANATGVAENTVSPYLNTYGNGIVGDLGIQFFVPGGGPNRWVTRLQGNTVGLDSTSQGAEIAIGNDFTTRTGYTGIQGGGFGTAGTSYGYIFRRGTGFMDIVCYTGTGTNTTQAHNLGVAPELMIVKSRSTTTDWYMYWATQGATNYSGLNISTGSAADSTVWNNTAPTASVFSLGTNTNVNASGARYIAYMWATLPLVSKVGTYTGTGALQSIDCGFNSASTRTFIMIMRTDANTFFRYVYNTYQGMSGSNDPYWNLSNGAAQVTGTNYVDLTTTGFQVTAAANATINVSGATYCYLAIY